LRCPLPRIALELFDLTLAVFLVEREGAGDDDLARREAPERRAVPGIVFPLKFRVAPVTPPPEQPMMLAEPETADDCVVWLMPGVNVACPLTIGWADTLPGVERFGNDARR